MRNITVAWLMTTMSSRYDKWLSSLKTFHPDRKNRNTSQYQYWSPLTASSTFRITLCGGYGWYLQIWTSMDIFHRPGNNPFVFPTHVSDSCIVPAARFCTPAKNVSKQWGHGHHYYFHFWCHISLQTISTRTCHDKTTPPLEVLWASTPCCYGIGISYHWENVSNDASCNQQNQHTRWWFRETRRTEFRFRNFKISTSN